MPTIMADHDSEGHLQVLLRLLTGAEWYAFWTALDVRVETFARLGLSINTPDADIWRHCQQQGIVLLTGNRNEDGPTSLEATIRVYNTPMSLPVLTISAPQRLLNNRAYAQRVAERFLECLIDVENLRGAGRLYLP
jgi:hypothetical protein